MKFPPSTPGVLAPGSPRVRLRAEGERDYFTYNIPGKRLDPGPAKEREEDLRKDGAGWRVAIFPGRTGNSSFFGSCRSGNKTSHAQANSTMSSALGSTQPG
jgi:hypothetical protein